MSKVSIIVPMYNVEDYVEKCLNSLLNQTFKDICIYAISDGSPDNSINIARKMAKKDKRIICIEKENGGYGSVLEYAIKKIETEYFLICDPDDYIDDNCIKTLYNAAEKYNTDLVVADKYLVYKNSEKKQYSSSNNKEIIVPYKRYEKKQLNLFTYLETSPHAKLYKTLYARDIKFPKKVNYTDTLLYYIYITKCNSALYINKALAYYLVDRTGNTVTDVSLKAIDSKLTVLRYIENQINYDESTKNTMYAIISSYMIVVNMVKHYANKNVKKEYYKKIYKELRKYKNMINLIKEAIYSTNIKHKFLRISLVKFMTNNNITFNIFKDMYVLLLDLKNQKGIK